MGKLIESNRKLHGGKKPVPGFPVSEIETVFAVN